MVDTEKENKKASTFILMGISLVILGLVIGFITLSQPKISVETDETGYLSTTDDSYTDETVVEDENAANSNHTQSSDKTVTTTAKTTTSKAVSYPLNLFWTFEIYVHL